MPLKRGEGAAKRQSVKVQFWYDDGTVEWVEGKEYEKWQRAVNGAIQNDFIHGAWAQGILKSVKWKKSASSPSALMAAVEALPVTVRYYCDDCMRPLSSKWDHSADHTIHETFLLEKAAFLNLLRSPPTEAAER